MQCNHTLYNRHNVLTFSFTV